VNKKIFSPHEIKLLNLAAQGLKVSKILKTMKIGSGTYYQYWNDIRRKSGKPTNGAALVFATQQNFITV